MHPGGTGRGRGSRWPSRCDRGRSQNQAHAGEHRQAPALRLHQVEERSRARAAVARRPPSHASANAAGVRRADDDVDIGLARGPRVGRAGERPRRRRSVSASIPPASRSRAARSGSLPLGRRRAVAVGRPAGDAVVAAPRRALAQARRSATAARCRRRGQRRRRARASSNAAVRRRGRADEPGEEVLAERLVMAVQLAVGRDDDERRRRRRGVASRAKRGTSRSRTNASASTVAAARTRPPPTAARRRGPRRSTGPSPRSMRYGRRVSRSCAVDLPRREDRVLDALVGQQPERRPGRPPSRAATSRSARRPKRSSKSRRPQRISVRRSAAEASGRMVWWNGWAMPVDARGRRRRTRGRRPGRPSSAIQPASVGPRSHDIAPRLPSSALGR